MISKGFPSWDGKCLSRKERAENGSLNNNNLIYGEVEYKSIA